VISQNQEQKIRLLGRHLESLKGCSVWEKVPTTKGPASNCKYGRKRRGGGPRCNLKEKRLARGAKKLVETMERKERL